MLCSLVALSSISSVLSLLDWHAVLFFDHIEILHAHYSPSTPLSSVHCSCLSAKDIKPWHWAAQHTTWLLIKVTPEAVVFPFLFFSQAMADPVFPLQLSQWLHCSQPHYTQQQEPPAQLLSMLATPQPPPPHPSPLRPPSPHPPPLPPPPPPKPMLNPVAEAQIMPAHMPTTSQLPMLMPSPLQAPQATLQ